MWNQRRHPVDLIREDNAMPNGGYPMHLLLPLPDTDLAVHVGATEVSIWRRVDVPGDTSDRRPVFETVATMTADQVGALMYHLLYWNGFDSRSLAAQLRSGVLPVGPKFTSANCLYEY